MMEKGVINIAALGRPFKLGMLYDRRTNTLNTNEDLWDINELNKYSSRQPQTWCNYSFIAEDSMEEKFSHVQIEAGLKLSFMLGLVKVDGSAQYLIDRKISKRQLRVSLNYKCTTYYEELAVNKLVNSTQSLEKLKKGTDTHIVVGIQYGAQAFFVFDRFLSKNEDKDMVHAELFAKVKVIPSGFSIGAELNKNKSMLDVDETIKCTYYGDFPLENKIVSYDDAITAYKTLPSLQKDISIPVEIVLLPLNMLLDITYDVKRIDDWIIKKIIDQFECYQDLKMESNDLLSSESCKNVDKLRNDIFNFQSIVEKSKHKLQKELIETVHDAISGKQEFVSLSTTLSKDAVSPVSVNHLSSWLFEKKTEVRVVEEFIEQGSSSVLDINLPISTADTLIQMNKFLSNDNCDESDSLPNTEKWYKNISYYEQMHKKLQEVKLLKETSDEDSDMSDIPLDYVERCFDCGKPDCPFLKRRAGYVDSKH